MSAETPESSAPLGEISQGPNALEQFLDRNQKGLIVAGIVIAIGAAAFVVHRGIETSHQQTAGAQLVKADTAADYREIVVDSADTTAAGSAAVLLADSQWADDKRDEAIGTLQKFISDSPGHAAIPSAKASLGAKLLAQGKTGEATRVFEDLAADRNAAYIAPYALISLGDMARAAGEIDKAEASYAKVKHDFPESPFADTANRRTSTLNAKPPVEISFDGREVGCNCVHDHMTTPPGFFQPSPDLPVPDIETPELETPTPTPVLPED